MSGDLLPPQLLYQGKAEHCHHKVDFPEEWDIWYSENHWSNESTMIRFADEILIPYVREMHNKLDLPLKQPALAVFDVFAAHRVNSFLTKLERAGIKVKLIPGGCTRELQPLVLSGNAQFKDAVKTQFVSWYANQISDQLKCGKSVEECDVDHKLTAVKPANARWIISAWEKLKVQTNVIKTGWYRSGMLYEKSK